MLEQTVTPVSQTPQTRRSRDHAGGTWTGHDVLGTNYDLVLEKIRKVVDAAR